MYLYLFLWFTHSPQWQSCFFDLGLFINYVIAGRGGLFTWLQTLPTFKIVSHHSCLVEYQESFVKEDILCYFIPYCMLQSLATLCHMSCVQWVIKEVLNSSFVIHSRSCAYNRLFPRFSNTSHHYHPRQRFSCTKMHHEKVMLVEWNLKYNPLIVRF